MYTYVQTQPPALQGLYTGSAGDGPLQMRPLCSQMPLASHSESYLLLKEEGAGEKRKAGVWRVVTGFSLILLPSVRGESLARAAPAGRNLYLCGRTCDCVCEHWVEEGIMSVALAAQPQKGLRTTKPLARMVTPV